MVFVLQSALILYNGILRIAYILRIYAKSFHDSIMFLDFFDAKRMQTPCTVYLPPSIQTNLSFPYCFPEVQGRLDGTHLSLPLGVQSTVKQLQCRVD